MPGLKSALTIRIADGVADRMVTGHCRGLRFTKVAPGGHQSLSFQMTVPRDTFRDLGPADRVYVYDARTGSTVIDGYLENPTPADGPAGQSFDISAIGGMALASDQSLPLVYIDQSYSGWYKTGDSVASATAEAQTEATTDPFQDPAVHLRFNPGQAINFLNITAARNSTLADIGMQLGAIQIYTYSGKNDGNYKLEFFTDSQAIAVGGDLSGLSTIGTGQFLWVVDNFNPTQGFGVRIIRDGGATNITDELTWSNVRSIIFVGRRMDRFGTLLSGASGLVSTSVVKASQVAEDVLGRVLTMCDPHAAMIDTTTFGITQLAYPEGVKAASILNDLSVFEPNFLWEVLETLDNGKHRFNYRAWPSTPRYEVSVKDGWQQRGSDADLCNRILVTWTDSTGKTQVTPVTAADLGLAGIGLPVDALGTRVKDAEPLTLPEGLGSEANATQIGGQILTDKINPPKAGTVVVRRPIRDMLTGNVVMPWEIESGYLCRVRETGDDLRITQVDYNDDSCSTVLQLGTPVLTTEQRLARLSRASGSIAA